MSPLLLFAIVILGSVIVGATVIFTLRARFRETIEAPEMRNVASSAAPVPVAEEVRAIGDQIEKAMSEQRLQGETQRQLLAQKLDSVRQTIDQQRTHVEGLRSEFRHESKRRDAEIAEVRAQIGTLHEAVGLPPAAQPQAALPPATPEPEAMPIETAPPEPISAESFAPPTFEGEVVDASTFISSFGDPAPSADDALPVEAEPADAEPDADTSVPAPFEPAPSAEDPAEPATFEAISFEIPGTPAAPPTAPEMFAEVSFAPTQPEEPADDIVDASETAASEPPASEPAPALSPLSEIAPDPPAEETTDLFAEMAFGLSSSEPEPTFAAPEPVEPPAEPADPFAFAPLHAPSGDSVPSEPSVFETWAPETPAAETPVTEAPAPMALSTEAPAPAAEAVDAPMTVPASEFTDAPPPAPEPSPVAPAPTIAEAPAPPPTEAATEPPPPPAPQTFAPVSFAAPAEPTPTLPADTFAAVSFETPSLAEAPPSDEMPSAGEPAPPMAAEPTAPEPPPSAAWVARSGRTDDDIDLPVAASADEFLGFPSQPAPEPEAAAPADDLIDLDALTGAAPAVAVAEHAPAPSALAPAPAAPMPEAPAPPAAPAPPVPEPVLAAHEAPVADVAPSFEEAPIAAPIPSAQATPDAEDTLSPDPAPEGAEDLTIISSVDEDVQRLLYQAGVLTLEEIAQWGRGDARRVSAAVQVSEDTIMNTWVLEAQAALFTRYSAQAGG